MAEYFAHINQFRWIAWFEITQGSIIIALHLVLFHGHDKCVQCKANPAVSKDEYYRETSAPITVADVVVSLIYA